MTSSVRALISAEKSKELNKTLGFDENPPPVPAKAKNAKWAKGLSEDALSNLTLIKTQIGYTIDETVITVARARLKIGSLLLEARRQFLGDNEFGKWRAEVLPDLATRTASNYMAMAERFKDAPEFIDHIGWTAARELISAPQAVVDEVVKKVEQGEKPTTEEIKQAKSSQSGGADKAPADIPFDDLVQNVVDKVKTKVVSTDKLVDRILQSDATTRIAAVIGGEFDSMDDYSKAAIIFGFGPGICDYKVNGEVWLAVYDKVSESLDDEGKRILDQAYSKMKEVWL